MGWFFRKSFKLAPGVRLNLSKRSLDISGGARGARVGANTRREKSVSFGGLLGWFWRKRWR